MKKLLVGLAVAVSGIVMGQEGYYTEDGSRVHPYGGVCDSNYVLDYRAIYGDTTSSAEVFVERYLSDRFGFRLAEIWFFELSDDPNELIVSVFHPNNVDIIMVQLCKLEEYRLQPDFKEKLLEEIEISNNLHYGE
jgi:hypothetical protein